jgi:polyadenylate-binding protein
MHCAEVEGQNIAVQVYQPRRTASGSMPEFSPTAAPFVPASVFSPYPTQVRASRIIKYSLLG